MKNLIEGRSLQMFLGASLVTYALLRMRVVREFRTILFIEQPPDSCACDETVAHA